MFNIVFIYGFHIFHLGVRRILLICHGTFMVFNEVKCGCKHQESDFDGENHDKPTHVKL